MDEEGLPLGTAKWTVRESSLEGERPVQCIVVGYENGYRSCPLFVTYANELSMFASDVATRIKDERVFDTEQEAWEWIVAKHEALASNARAMLT